VIFARRKSFRIGWVASDTLGARRPTFATLVDPVQMRIGNVAHWIDRNTDDVETEMYRRSRRYDVVVFHKAMDDDCLAEVSALQRRGTRVVFDANVNYYEVDGDYDVPGTQPTPEQQRQAIAMTSLADLVVADSTFILSVAARFNEHVVHVPDNVDLGLFSLVRRHEDRSPVRFVWSGVAVKADPLLDIADALAKTPDAELLVVAERPPDILPRLQAAIPVRFEPWSIRRYAKLLADSDAIISPKRLVNRYELGHTEWKITLGMACGLPAVASPQQSYIEALEGGGGFVARTADDWGQAFQRLRGDVDLRRDLGARARATVEERYATPVVARRYLDALRELL
jgi:glycosyltransferase involved in cell wall biosynthesis